jgi:nitrogen fixation NifU-like protein
MRAIEGVGCSISQASISMMDASCSKENRTGEAVELLRRFSDMMRGDEEAARDQALGDLRALGRCQQVSRNV